jgi:ABC-type multidrug transport system fused ATPase/permease subunit
MARNGKEDNNLPKAKLDRSSLAKTARLFKHFGKEKWKLYLGLVFLMLTSLTLLAFPWLLRELIKTVEDGEFAKINQIGFLLILVLVGQSIFSFFRIYLFVNYTEHTLAALRQAIYAHLITLPMTFFATNRVGDLNSRMSADIAQIQDTLTTSIAEFLRQFLLIIGGIVFLLFISPKLTLLMLCILPVIAIAAVIFGRFIKKTASEVQGKVAQSNTIIEETLQGIVNVKAFANEYFENKRYKASTEDVVVKAIKGGVYRGAFAAFIIFCLFGAIVAVIWYGVILASHNEMVLADLFSFMLYSAFVGASFGGIAEIYAQIQKAVGATERVFAILDESPEMIDISINEKEGVHLEGNVAFENVTFAYPSRSSIQVLNNVTISATKGETVAIVGPSGSGKSTLVSLLLRFYDPNSGTIRIDGVDAKDYSLATLRNNMAIVPQDVLLFGGTIQENIAYGKPDATLEEITEAARKANALEFINSFPEQLETIVGERGIQLSGGQRQRIAIARAVLKNPSILILDEATSALDSESERLVQEALDKLMVGRTSFVIAHRLSTIRKADKIIVIDKGAVAESGTHESLMANANGLYRNLNTLQMENA